MGYARVEVRAIPGQKAEQGAIFKWTINLLLEMQKCLCFIIASCCHVLQVGGAVLNRKAVQ